MTTTTPIDVYWSFRSPYSYLATPDMLDLARDFDVDVHLRPVLPIAVRNPDFFRPENMPRARYIVMDWHRRAEFLGRVHEWPSPDPIVQDLETLKISDDQPYIFRLTALGVEAERRGKGIEFAKEVSHVLFSGTKDWHLSDHMAKAAARAGLDLQEMEAEIAEGDHLDEVAANQNALESAGHWGVPTFVFKGEPFFGQDRIDLLRWRLEQSGLRRG